MTAADGEGRVILALREKLGKRLAEVWERLGEVWERLGEVWERLGEVWTRLGTDWHYTGGTLGLRWRNAGATMEEH